MILIAMLRLQMLAEYGSVIAGCNRKLRKLPGMTCDELITFI